MKGERMAKKSSFGSIMRKRLSDITNTQSQSKLRVIEEKHPQVTHSTDVLVGQLLMEKATLVKLLEERNKIIELSGSELRNLRTSYQRLQLQNLNLAQSNSHMLAELNSGREKLKALQHELLCKEALLKAKTLELEGRADKNPSTVSKEGEKKIDDECLQKAKNDVKACNRNRRRTARSQSMGPSTAHQQAAEKEKVESKRRCVRRQSARFKSQEREPTENLFEIENAKFPITQPLNDSSVQEARLTQLAEPCAIKEEICSPRKAAQASPHRASMGRPLRRAAVKVQSYREVPLNIKMRRQE